MRNWKPIYIENSRILGWLSYLTPINIQAIILGVIVISRDEMSEVTKNHETIHFQQYLETLFLGFLILYFWDWFIGLVKYRDGQKAYLSIRAEQEAYKNQENLEYLPTDRKRWCWLQRSDPTLFLS
ncbi:TPA: hypothetical protein EYN98_32440 [Candidatus Poribacteria bacterium]|jgi:hypothetical protein|nr:hypothetical protein [Candidatus Poribacteria bacterium]HIA70675.1 hypothetical protein [Candidatus Poribacteria bacterium]HIB89470.1 hypothetical protein [Candidatus Poribacteria bacterium]